MKDYLSISSKPSVIWAKGKLIQDKLSLDSYTETYFKWKEYCENNHDIQMKKIIDISDKVTIGFTSKRDYQNDGIKFLNISNLKPFEIDTTNIKYISKDTHNKLEKSKLNEGDVLLTITGTIGDSTVVPKSLGDANISANIVTIKPKKNFDSYYISTFFNSNYGKLQTKGSSKSNVWSNLGLTQVRKIEIPIPSPEIQKYIGDKVRRAEELREEAERLKEKAEEILDKELNLSKLGEVKKESEEQKNRWVKGREIEGRIDSEFYHPKYNFYDKAGFSLDKIEDHFKISKKRIRKNHAGKIRYIDLSSINNLISPQYMDIEDAPSRAQLIVKKDDTIISSLSGSKKIGIISEDLDGCICSTGFVVLECISEKITPEYLYAIFTNELFNLQVNKYSSGAIMSGVTNSDFKKMYVPIVENKSIIDKITDNIRNYFYKLRVSRDLIQEAKQDVEDLIEGNFDMSRLNKTE